MQELYVFVILLSLEAIMDPRWWKSSIRLTYFPSSIRPSLHEVDVITSLLPIVMSRSTSFAAALWAFLPRHPSSYQINPGYLEFWRVLLLDLLRWVSTNTELRSYHAALLSRYILRMNLHFYINLH